MSGLNIQRIRDIFDSVYDSATGVLKTSGSGGGGSSSITSNSSITYGAGATDAKTQRVAIASDANSVVFASPQAVTQSGAWTVGVTGTFWQATQPVSIASLPSASLLQTQTTLTQLIAPSSSSAVSMAGYSKAFITTLIEAINTNVVIRIEGSNDNTNWANLSATSTDTTITANGTYGFSFVGCPQYIRVTFVSESGGTAVTIDAIVRVSA